jgi:AraC-like DNA-binding protein
MIFRILKMPARDRNYFRYFQWSPAGDAWGLGVTAAGYTEVAPRTPYPPTRHPADHDFSWESGRILKALQVVSIHAGSGWFESRQTGRKKISAGMAFILLPGVWHRYRPNERTGWTESWLEMKGPTVARLRRSGVLTPQEAVRRGAAMAGLDETIEAVHVRARVAGGKFDPELTSRALGVLAAWAKAGQMRMIEPPVIRAMIEAERILAAQHTEPINIEELARRLGVAYSHFRRRFREHTGYAPWAYVIRLRLVRARRLLAAGNATLDDIAQQLGFSSAFHFSSAFKQAFGQSPDHWRRGLKRSAKR